MNFTCHSCRWAMGSIAGLHCGKKDEPATKACRSFEYEPGSDECEVAQIDREANK